MNPTVQAVIVGVVVLACAWRAFARYAPATAWRARATLAYALERPGRPAWLRWVGVRLRPSLQLKTAGCGSDDGGCSSCGTCAPVAAPPVSASIPVQLLP
jgi:hypothetical protein